MLSDLENAGYAWWTFVIPACAVDAKHRRDRIWIIANAVGNAVSSGQRGHNGRWPGKEFTDGHKNVPNAKGKPIGTGFCQDKPGGKRGRRSGDSGGEVVANTSNQGLSRSQQRGTHGEKTGSSRPTTKRGTDEGRTNGPTQSRLGVLAAGLSARLAGSGWLPEPGIGRVARGVFDRVNKLKALGNAVVPAVVEQIGCAIMDAA